MAADEILSSFRNLGRDASRLIFEDELTGIYNRRFLLHYFEHKVAWEGSERQPVSLLMMDLDHFKQINDGYGHLTGDQALIHVAKLLKQVAGEAGLPIRYAGDEFMILLPGKRKPSAMQLGEHLLEQCRTRGLAVDDGEKELRVTLSMGCASSPEDAHNGRTLIQKADAALYYAKKSGRDRLVNAAEVALNDVPQKAALQNLRGATIVGRHAQLARVTESYEQFGQGRSQFVIVEGAAGMGKTTFLDTLHQALAKKEHRLVRVNGVHQEGYRPYYLLTTIVRGLLNQQDDKGASIFGSLTEKETACLYQVLPHLNEMEMAALEENESDRRECIFSMLLNFLPRLVDFEPLVVLVDDLQFVDAATLLLLRRLILRHEIPLFVCGTSLSTMAVAAQGQQTPLERFCLEYGAELDLHKILLTPLSEPDIERHLRGLFPQIVLPDEFTGNLLRISQGNPLILGEVVRKLVLDQKITLVGQQWVLQPLEEGYLPKSLDEIVAQKISALDEESRQILAHASTLGEDVPVSMLAGSSEKMASKIEDFIERSVELGLISSDFRDNDEIIRFLGKRVLDITYGSLDQEDRQRLHENVGTYQEKLYDQKLLPSASYLAYHFKRSANREKARRYEELQAAYNTKVFNVEEAVHYTGDLVEDGLSDAPLPPDSLAQIPHVIRSLLTAVRTAKLYPPESKTVVNANLQVAQAVNEILGHAPVLKITQEENALLVNGQTVDVSEYKGFADNFLDFMRSVELGTIGFQQGLHADEMHAFLRAVAQLKPAETLDPRFWKRFAVKQRLSHVHLKQVKYAQRGGRKEEGSVAAHGPPKLTQEDLGLLQDIIRSLLSTSKNIKIYPLKSRTVTSSLEQLIASLSTFLGTRPGLTLAIAGNSLLVNGDKVDTSEFKAVADGFLEFLGHIGLGSLTFLRGVSMAEVESFAARFRELPTSGASSDFWTELNDSEACPHILFDAHLYGIELEAALSRAGQEAPREEQPQPQPQPQEPQLDGLGSDWQEESFPVFVEAFPERVGVALRDGASPRLRALVERLFSEYASRERPMRDKILEVCRRGLKSAPMGFKQELSKLLAEPLLGLLPGETDAKLLGTAAETLHEMAEALLPFADYLPAIRVFSQLLGRLRDFERSKDARAQVLAKVMDRKLDPKTQGLLVEDLKSGDTGRQQTAAQLLGALGAGSQSMLIDVIKHEEDLRVRQIAAGLLAQLGPKAGEQLKQALVLEVSAQGRSRILEVIDAVTQSLHAELSFALGDENRRVRKAAFQLTERLNDKDVWALLMNHASSDDPGLATGAIKCLGKLRPPGTTDYLVSLLNSTKQTERAIACCQALGQIADTASIETLARVLASKGFWIFGKRWNAQVRAAAAFALRQMPRGRVAQVLRPLQQDRDPRVRQIARSFAKG